MTTKIPAAMVEADVATQAELDAINTALDARLDTLELTGRVVQVVNTQSGAVATGTTTAPFDDTIPQNTEGNALAALDTAITPRSASNKLKIDVVLVLAHATATSNAAVMLFRDSVADALAVTVSSTPNGANQPITVTLTHYMTAPDTSAHTFKVRYGSSVAGTLTVNGSAGARLYGGVMASSLTVTEIAA